MTRREIVLAAIDHKETPRIPIDLGGMDSTGITAIAYNNLKKHLEIAGGYTRVYDPYQQIAIVEDEVLTAIGADVKPVPLLPKQWKPSKLPDGSACEVPEKWNPVLHPDGSQAIVDQDGIVQAVMPANGLYFEPVNSPLAAASSIEDIGKSLALIESVDWPSFCDEEYAGLEKRAREIYQNSDYAVMGNFAVHIFAGGQMLRGYEQFMVDLLADRDLAHRLLELLTQVFIERFDRYWKAVGEYVQIVNVNDDLGTENAPMISPELYKTMIKPYHKRLFSHIRESGARLFLHSDGSIYDLISDLIDCGVQILNPIQFSCKNMDLTRLKSEFGKDLTFWGGGCDTQQVLPFGTPEQVREHVTKCLSILAPNGGFVFNQVHNIQPDAPSENIMAMYEAVRTFTQSGCM